MAFGFQVGIFLTSPGVYVINYLTYAMRRPPKLPPDAKTQALREAGALHPHPDAVRDDAFLSHPFFDPRDRVQVKYEMVRRHRVDGRPVTEVAARFGVSRQTFYQTAAAFEAHGIPGLVPKRPGPKGAHKCTDAIVDYVERWRVGLLKPRFSGRESTGLIDEVGAWSFCCVTTARALAVSLLLTELGLSSAIAVAFEKQDLGMVGQAVDQSDGARGVGEDGVPAFEG